MRIFVSQSFGLMAALALTTAMPLHAAEFTATASNEINSIEALKTLMEMRLDQMGAQLDKETSERIKADDLLDDDIADLGQKVTTMQTTVDTLKSDVSGLATRVKNSETAITILNGAVDALTAQTSSLANRLKATEADLKVLKPQMAQAMKDIDDLWTALNKLKSQVNGLADPVLVFKDVTFTGLYEKHDWTESGSAYFYGRKSDLKTDDYPACFVKGGVNLDGVDYKIVQKDGYWAMKMEDAYGQSEGLTMSCIKFK